MPEARRFVCSRCGRDVVAWSDGNPYYRDESGRKRHAYHPDHAALARCVGNDVPHLCLGCGRETTVDSVRPRTRCRRCGHGPLVPTYELDGHRCPDCPEGRFALDRDFEVVS